MADLDDIYAEYWPRLESKRNELLGAKLYTQNIICLPDLARESPLIAGQQFENIVFKGPAVIALLEVCSFVNCGFYGFENIESMIWERDVGVPLVGAIGVSRCSFNKCDFEGIGFTAPREVLERFRNTGRMGNDGIGA